MSVILTGSSTQHNTLDWLENRKLCKLMFSISKLHCIIVLVNIIGDVLTSRATHVATVDRMDCI